MFLPREQAVRLTRRLLMLAFAGACSADGDAQARSGRARVSGQPFFTATDGSSSGLRRIGEATGEHALRVAPAPRGFIVRYALDTSGQCVAPHSVEHRVHSDTVDVTLFYDRPGPCLAVVTYEEYEVVVEGLRAGRYIVRISSERGQTAPYVELVDTVKVAAPRQPARRRDAVLLSLPSCRPRAYASHPMEHEIKDITVIGAGPAGLFALFYAGMRGASAQVVDALPEVGGQLAALYPEKFIFDVAGHPKVLAKDLVRSLREQAAQFGEPVHLRQAVTGLEERDGHFVLQTSKGSYPTRSIVIAAGIGAFSPRRLPQACAEPWYERGIYDVVSDPAQFRGQRVVIVGGGDSAFDWATQLKGVATHVSLVHRSDRFRAHGATVTQFEADVAAGAASIFTFHELSDVLCKPEGDRFTHLVLKQVKTKELVEIQADVVLPMLGFVSDIGPIADWGLSLRKDEIVVNQTMETGRPGIWAAGDVTTYEGKLKLIACGFSEAAIAVNQAVHWIYPEKKVAPGHSSNMAVFGQKDD